MQEGKVASEEASQIAEKRREAKGKGEKKKRQRRSGRKYSSECRVPKNSKER